MLEETLLLSPKQWPDLGGTWSSLGDDGTYSDITLIINASSAGGFGVTCTDAGPDDGCDPVTARHDTQGRVGGWHHAHGSTHARSVKVQFDNQAMNSGITDANNSVIAWQDGSRCASQKLLCCCLLLNRVLFAAGERKHPDQVNACCALCTAAAHRGCKGWTLSCAPASIRFCLCFSGLTWRLLQRMSATS